MNACTTITAAPFEIGQGLINSSGRRAWIVAIDPVDNQGGLIRRQMLLVGGPSPMAEICWNVQTVDDGGNLSAHDEHTIARLIAKYPPIPACADPAAMLADALARKERFRQEMREREAAAAVAREKAAADLVRYAPTWAKAAIIAELVEDQSDSMTDYHGHKTLRTVVIGWSKHERDLFPEMRKAAATFPETAHLADAPESAEHREKYSMGAGYYLKTGWRDSSGWGVKKRRISWLRGDVLEFSDFAKTGRAAPAPTVETESPAPTMGNAAGLFRISEHTHTKKGFQFWLCELVERVEREDFDRFLTAAKALGGWYSRPWGGTPGGFAFKRQAAALEFAGQGEGPEGPQGGTPTDGEGKAAPRPVAPTVNPADKLREMADNLQSAIDDKNRDRRANTPKQRLQATQARHEAADLERAQSIMRALADHHDAGTVPACLQRVTTKAAILELAKEEIDRSNAGYYDAGFPTGRPYPWHDTVKAEQAAAAWALLDHSAQAERRAAEELRQKIEGLKFAKIPGYFPTPADLVARMIQEADLLPGSRVLEPSAGSGAIADALRDAGHVVECIERNGTLRQILEAKGHKVIASDFLEASPPMHPAPLYDAVLMNPPFEAGQDCEHVARAWAFVKPGGSLVAIMGAGVTFRNQRPYSTFRAWADEIGTFDPIPAGAFAESGTGVASVLFFAVKSEG